MADVFLKVDDDCVLLVNERGEVINGQVSVTVENGLDRMATMTVVIQKPVSDAWFEGGK